MAQSMLLDNQLPKRPFLMCSGTHCTSWLVATKRSLRAVVRMYQLGLAKNNSGVLQRQQKG